MVRARASRSAAVAAVALLATSACGSEFDTKLAEVERLRVAAADAGYEWLETEELLARARDEAAAGNVDEAMLLIEQARFQADAAIRQAEHEAGAWQSRVVR